MSKKSKQPSKPFKFGKHQIVGTPDAESDHYLQNVFIENGDFQALRDVTSPKCIIIGRTGAGKSALIKYFEENVSNVTRIEPESMSIKYLSNSTILDYLRSIDINLNFFYKVLWKHVFIVELLKMYFEEDLRKKESFFENLSSALRNALGKPNPGKEKAISYLKKWSDEFWLNSEHRIKTLENELSSKFQTEAGIAIEGSKIGSSREYNNSNKTITEIKQKAEKVISESQADEIYEIINIMKNDLFNNTQKRYYIVIDDLDKEWVSPQIVHDLIGAMIEVIKEFQVFKGCKIIIALRDNLHQLVFSAKKHRGGQREKFSSLYLDIEWDKSALRALVDRRLLYVSDNSIDFTQVFEKESGNKETGFEYLLARTFYRPRDVISFMNKIIKNSNSKAYFNTNIIKKAEPEYSLERLQAIEDEWNENYGDIKQVCSIFIGMHNGFRVKNIGENLFSNIYDERLLKAFKGELLTAFEKWVNNKLKFRDFVKELLSILYNIGIIGIKKGPNYAIQFFYDGGESFTPAEIEPEAKIYIHKAFYSALKINVKELENDYLD